MDLDDPFNFVETRRIKTKGNATQKKTTIKKKNERRPLKEKPKVKKKTERTGRKIKNTLADVLHSNSSSPEPPPKKKRNEEVCARCHVPLNLFGNRREHEEMCLDSSDMSYLNPACPGGKTCSSKVVNHYKEYNHRDLPDRLYDQTTVLAMPGGNDRQVGDYTGLDEPEFTSTPQLGQALPTRFNNSPARGEPASKTPAAYNFEDLEEPAGTSTDRSVVGAAETLAANRQKETTDKTPTTNETKSSKRLLCDLEGSPMAGPSGLNRRPMSKDIESNSQYEQSLNLLASDNSQVLEAANFSQTQKKVDQVPELNLSLEPSQSQSVEPFSVTATKDQNGLKVSVLPAANNVLTGVEVSVPNVNGEKEILVSAKYKSPSKQGNLKAAKEKWKKMLPSLQKKGFVTPLDVPLNNSDAGDEATKRKCPWYKKIPDTSFSVDAFNHGQLSGVKYYFLSHYHYDHYQGLTGRWSEKIVCSSITKRLIVSFLKVKEHLVTTVDVGDCRVVDGVEVTSVEANHCPGSLMFVFRLTNGQTLLHTGDFRASIEMESEAVFWNNNMDKVYLDTTYCKPQYDFPSQSDVIEATVSRVRDFLNRRPEAVIFVGAYTIGKERIFKAIAEALNCKIWAEPKRLKTWNCINDPDVLKRVTADRGEARVHVVDMRKVGWKFLPDEWKKVERTFGHILAIKPTGWTHHQGSSRETSLQDIKIKPSGTNISMLEVPYSEHSSYSELKRFIQFLNIKSEKCVIPTVNMRDIPQMKQMFRSWIA